MHLEVLVEDKSGKEALEILIPKIIGGEHTFRVHSYKGIGRIPKNLARTAEPKKRILFEQLPRLLRGYGNAFANYPPGYSAAVILVCDLDDKCLIKLRADLHSILHLCNPEPKTRFCIAIEEGEAWFLGDFTAIKSAHPRAKSSVLNTYINDSIIGTWELLADAIYPGGHHKLSAKGWHQVGIEKSIWSKKIAPHMDVDNNNSPSFCYFRSKIRELTFCR